MLLHVTIFIESFELEGTPNGHLVQLSCADQGHLQLDQVLRAPSNLTWRVSSVAFCNRDVSHLC